ncbi:MAG: 5-oxoprolinase subunit B family protein [Roseinatronobacter sp.]
MPVTPETPKWPIIQGIGVDGFLITFNDSLTEAANRAALAFRAALDGAGLCGVEETSTSLASVYLRFDLRAVDHETLRAALAALLQQADWYAAPLPTGRKLWRVPAVFGTALAPQLKEAASLAGLTPEQAIAELCAHPLRVQAIGFAPGQPYLGQLPPPWDIPRQTGLTPRVPEGALAVAIRQMVLFSVSTPTGWRHVGQTALRLFQPDQPDPFILRPGDEVQLVPVTRAEFENIRQSDALGGATSQAVA